MSLSLSAVICTRNRAAWTRRALQSLVDQDLPPERLDIIVVDNGSTDETPRVVEEIASRCSNVRYVFEPTAGLSRARNRAIVEARGDVIAFLDDDAVAVRSWARLHLDAYESDAGIVATGGRIVLSWPGERPSWLPLERETLYAGLDLGPEQVDIEHPRMPFGANMAVRRSVFDDLGAFSTRLGRTGGDLVSGEERDLVDRIRASGGRIVYLPDASVDHHVLPDRTGPRWLLRRSYDQGRSIVLIDELRRTHRSRSYWVGRAGFQAGRSGRFLGQAAGRRLARRPLSSAMASLTRAAQAAGTARESARVAVRAGKGPAETPASPS